MIVQGALLVTSCSHGWGSDLSDLSSPHARLGDKVRCVCARPLAMLQHNVEPDDDQYFFASNIAMILVYACSRASVLASLQQANEQTKYARYNLVLSGMLSLWLLGSLLGLALHRLSGPDFWSPPGQDLNVRAAGVYGFQS